MHYINRVILVDESKVLRVEFFTDEHKALVAAVKEKYPKMEDSVDSWIPGWGHQGRTLNLLGDIVYKDRFYLILSATNFKGLLFFVPEEACVPLESGKGQLIKLERELKDIVRIMGKKVDEIKALSRRADWVTNTLNLLRPVDARLNEGEKK